MKNSIENLKAKVGEGMLKDLNEYQIITIKDLIQKAYNEGHADGFAVAKNELKTN